MATYDYDRRESSSPGIVQAWQDWVQAGGTREKVLHRKLIVQIIDALQGSHKWLSYEKAVENMLYGGFTPDEGKHAIGRALEVARRCEWNPAKLRQEFR